MLHPASRIPAHLLGSRISQLTLKFRPLLFISFSPNPTTAMPPHTPTLLPKHIYAEELISRGHGSPLWYPEPSQYGEIHVGDVGFRHDSSFYRLFNAMCESTDSRNSLGVPKGFRRLNIPGHLIHLQTVLPAGPICAESTNYCSTSAGASVGRYVCGNVTGNSDRTYSNHTFEARE